MKAIVLCAGQGTRLRPLTHTLTKHLIPVANKPVLFYGLENLVAAHVREIGIVVSPATQAAIRAAVGAGEQFGARITYVEQSEARGLAHAANCARGFVGRQPFLMYLGDTLLPEGFAAIVERFHAPQTNGAIMLAPVDDPRRYGIAELAGDRIVRLVEKPQRPASNLAVAGAYVFDHHIFEAIDRLQPSWRNEYEITDAVQDLIDHGLTVRACTVPGWWKDTGTPADLLEANQVLLQRINADLAGVIDTASRITGLARIEAGAQIVNSQINGPAIIGREARVVNATIGPFVSIGARVEVLNGTVADSIIMEAARLDLNGARVERSVLGRNAALRGHAGAVVSATLADDCQVGVTAAARL
ncbi:MAG TPA: glucose-1-phosphate thymidylyltransferase [Candidatus Kryptonia bacterium]|nr:glucose-1-phosphate thymidylyltransferase [Candidatus Kryptonia bacterium]